MYAWRHVQLTGTNRPRAWFYINNSMSNWMFVLAVEFLKHCLFDKNIKVSVAMAVGSHPFPFRTRKLSPPAPMVLGWRRPGRVGRRRISQEMGSRKAPHLRLTAGNGAVPVHSCGVFRWRFWPQASQPSEAAPLAIVGGPRREEAAAQRFGEPGLWEPGFGAERQRCWSAQGRSKAAGFGLGAAAHGFGGPQGSGQDP